MFPSSPYFSLERYARGVGGGEAIAAAFRLHNPVPHLPTHSSQLLSYNNTFPLLKLSPAKPLFCRLHHLSASLSSFASVEDEPKAEADAETEEKPQPREFELPQMAKAFHISSRMASAISICQDLAYKDLATILLDLAISDRGLFSDREKHRCHLRVASLHPPLLLSRPPLRSVWDLAWHPRIILTDENDRGQGYFWV